jgi:hypothetical protein
MADTTEQLSTLFAHLVIQQSNMAMMLLGRVPHPETGEVVKDLEAARLFIDQLEMLEVKTKGNLTKEEDGLLKQSLMALRLAFVETVGNPAAETQPGEGGTASPGTGAAAARGSDTEEESRKKFTKKY